MPGVDNNQQVKNKSVVSVFDYPFGAKGDGVTDDTYSIQLAIVVANGGEVYFPKADYFITSVGAQCLLINNNTSLNFCPGARLIVGATVGSSTDIIRLLGPSTKWRCTNMEIAVESGTPGRHGINLDASSTFAGERAINKSVIDHCKIAQLGGRAISTTFPLPWLDGIFDYVISNCVLTGGIALNRAGDLGRIHNNIINGVGPCIYVNLVGSGTATANQLLIQHNSITGSLGCIVIVEGQRTKIVYNYFEPLSGSDPSVNACLVDLQGQALYPLAGIEISNNLFSGTPGTCTYLLRCDYVTSANIFGNTFALGTGLQRGIKTTANISNINVYGNVPDPSGTALSSLFSADASTVQHISTDFTQSNVRTIGSNLQVKSDAGATQANLSVIKSAGQTADLFNLIDENGNALFSISNGGILSFPYSLANSIFPSLNITDSAASSLKILYFDIGSDYLYIGPDGATGLTGGIILRTNNSEKARLTPTGKLLVGKTSPITGTAAGWVDAVGFAASGLTNYASNALASAGGLAPGCFYRNGDNVCIVH